MSVTEYNLGKYCGITFPGVPVGRCAGIYCGTFCPNETVRLLESLREVQRKTKRF